MDSILRDMIIGGPVSTSLTMLDDMSKLKSEKVKQITQQDVFPCYSCANERSLVSECAVCNHMGFLKGDHPMVKMIEQIIDSKFSPDKSPNINIQDLEYTLGRDLSQSIVPEEVHTDFQCDGCRMDPIRGKRYHCRECSDFDLCEKCFQKKEHHHEFELGSRRTVLFEKKKLDKDTQRSMLMQSSRVSAVNPRFSNIHL